MSLKLVMNSDLKFGQLTLFVFNHGKVHYSVTLPSVQFQGWALRTSPTPFLYTGSIGIGSEDIP